MVIRFTSRDARADCTHDHESLDLIVRGNDVGLGAYKIGGFGLLVGPINLRGIFPEGDVETFLHAGPYNFFQRRLDGRAQDFERRACESAVVYLLPEEPDEFVLGLAQLLRDRCGSCLHILQVRRRLEVVSMSKFDFWNLARSAT